MTRIHQPAWRGSPYDSGTHKKSTKNKRKQKERRERKHVTWPPRNAIKAKLWKYRCKHGKLWKITILIVVPVYVNRFNKGNTIEIQVQTYKTFTNHGLSGWFGME